MRAFIREECKYEFGANSMAYGFFNDLLPTGERVWVRNPRPDDPKNHTMLIITSDMELHLVTPMGESPFMEAHKDCYEDLIDKGYIEFREGEFD